MDNNPQPLASDGQGAIDIHQPFTPAERIRQLDGIDKVHTLPVSSSRFLHLYTPQAIQLNSHLRTSPPSSPTSPPPCAP